MSDTPSKSREFWLGTEAQRYAHREFPTAEGDAIHVIEYSEYERILKLNKTAAKQIMHEIDLGQTAINYKESLVAAQKELSQAHVEIERLAAKANNFSIKFNDLKAELETAQKECEEQARLNGMGAQRELKLKAELEQAKAELENAKAKAYPQAQVIQNQYAEIQRLKAELERANQKYQNVKLLPRVYTLQTGYSWRLSGGEEHFVKNDDLTVVHKDDYDKLQARVEALEDAIKRIDALGMYCCDDEGRGHECPAHRIARAILKGEK